MHELEEHLEIVTERGDVIGLAARSAVHGNPLLLHRVVHVLVFDDQGALLLQKRSSCKDVAPGKWDTSVGGHMSPGETVLEAAEREMGEELGIAVLDVLFLYSYIHSNAYESEFVYTHSCIHNGPFHFDAGEIEELRFWSMEEIAGAIGSGILSDNFESEVALYMNYRGAAESLLTEAAQVTLLPVAE